MNLRRHSSGILLVVLAAGIGYLLIQLPPVIIEQYHRAQEIGPTASVLYLVAVGLGCLLLGGVMAWLVVKVWINTRKKKKQREGRQKNPSQLTANQQQEELKENLAAGTNWADEAREGEAEREAIRKSIAKLESKLETESLEIVAFGTISSGKSSLLNALAGREMFRTDPVGGTTVDRNEVPWPGNDRVTLVDTPGLAEVQGEDRAARSAAAANDADLVLLVVDGPLKDYEVALLRRLGQMEKRVLVCLNKEDWFSPDDRQRLVAQIIEQVTPTVRADDVVTVQARPATRSRVRVLPDGTETTEEVPTEIDIEPLAARMLEIVTTGGRELLLANLLLQSRGLVEKSKLQATASLDKHANELITKYMWAAGGVAAVNPIPLLDLAGGSAIAVKMVLDLARVYRQTIDADTVVTLLGNLSKNLIAMLGVTAATPAITAMLASLLKTVPGVGTIAGGLIQGLVQALITRWIGKVFAAYFRAGMQDTPAGLAELARTEWEEVTKPKELLKLIQTGRKMLSAEEE